MGGSTTLTASANGVVVDLNLLPWVRGVEGGTRGNWITIEYRDAQGNPIVRVTDFHLAAPSTLTEGQEVNVNTVIGEIGSTGNSTGVHLHREIRVRNANGGWDLIDPLTFDDANIVYQPAITTTSVTATTPPFADPYGYTQDTTGQLGDPMGYGNEQRPPVVPVMPSNALTGAIPLAPNHADTNALSTEIMADGFLVLAEVAQIRPANFALLNVASSGLLYVRANDVVFWRVA